MPMKTALLVAALLVEWGCSRGALDQRTSDSAVGGDSDGTAGRATADGRDGWSAELPSPVADGSVSLAACARHACPNPFGTPGFTGVDTGFEYCDPVVGGVLRREVKDCPQAGVVRASSGACHCDDPNAYCVATEFASGFDCQPGCLSDSECGPGRICLCANRLGSCVPATCSSGASCGAGCDCIAINSGPSRGNMSGAIFSCQTAVDDCARPADCAPTQDCVTFATGHFCRNHCNYYLDCSTSEVCVYSESESYRYCLPDCSGTATCAAGTRCQDVTKMTTSNGFSAGRACVPG